MKSNPLSCRVSSFRNPFFAALLIGLFSLASTLHAANYTWDSTAGGGLPVDGAGAWNTTGTNWWNGAIDSAWTNLTTDTAVFGASNGTAGAITVGTVTVGGITFNAAGSGNYTLSGGTITLGGATPTITANVNATIGSTLAGSAGLTTGGGGVLTLIGANSYTGATVVSNGTLQIGNGGTAGSISSSGTITLSSAGSTLAFNRTDNYGGNFGALITGSGGLTVSSGTLTLSNNQNSFTGNVAINNATVNVSNGNASATQSQLGNPLTVTRQITIGSGGNINFTGGDNAFGNVGQSPTIQFVLNGGNMTQVSNAATTLGQVTLNSGTLTNLCSASPSFTGFQLNGTVYVIGGISKLMGSGSYGFLLGDQTIDVTSGATLQVAAALNDFYSGGARGFTKANAGSMILAGSNNYTGATTINGGKVVLGNGGSLAATAVTVNAGGTFGVSQTADGNSNSVGNATLSLAAGSAFTMADGFTSTLNVAGAATLAPAAGTKPTLTFDIGGATGATTDLLAIAGAATVNANGATLTINAVGGQVLSGTYTFMTAASGLGSNFTLLNSRVISNNVAYLISLTGSATGEGIVIGASGAPTLYWSGTLGSVWNTLTSGTTNWNSDAASGTNVARTPNLLTDVYFSTTNPVAQNLTNTLGASTTISSLNFTSSAGAVTIAADGSTLTIANTSGTSGISVASGAAAQAINVPVVLAATQYWANNSSNTLTVAGNISGTGGLIASGSGTLSLGGSNSYTGNTAINAGILNLNNANALASTGTISFGGGTLQYSPSNVVDYSAKIGGGSAAAISIDTNSQNVTFTSTFLGTNSNGLTKSGSGTLTLAGSNSLLSGPITINGGTLKRGAGNGTPWYSNYGGATTPLIVNGGTFDVNGGTNFWTGMISGTNSQAVITNSNAAAASLLFGGTGTGTYAGQLQNGVGGLSLDYRGNGSILTLTGSSNITSIGYQPQGLGETIVVGTGGQLNITSASVLGNGNSNGSYLVVNGGTLTTAERIEMGEFGSNTQFVINSGTATVHDTTGWTGVGTLKSGTNNQIILNGGVLATTKVGNGLQQANIGSTLQFNGGTLRAISNYSSGSPAYALIGNAYNGYTEMAVTTSGSGALIDTGTFSQAVMRPIADGTNGVGGLTKLGTGTLTLGPVMTYTGTTTVSAGTLVLDYGKYASGTSTTLTSLLPSGAALNIAGGATLSILGRPNGLSSSGTWTLGLPVGGGGSSWSAQQIDFVSGPATGVVVGAAVSGSGIAAGTYVLDISNIYHPILSTVPTSAGSSSLTFSPATFSAMNETFGSIGLTSGTGTINADSNGGSGMSVTVTGAVTGAGALLKTGNGLLTLNGSSSYSGGTIISGGALTYGDPNALGSGTLTLGVNTTVQSGVAGTVPNNVTISPSVTGTFDTQSYAANFGGVIGGSGVLSKIGSGTLTLSGSNSYSGGTLLKAGVLALGNGGALGTAGNIVFTGGTMQYTGSGATDYSGRIVNSTSAITVDTNGQNVTFGTSFATSNTGGFVKNGTGTLVFAADMGDNLAKMVTVNGGILKQTVDYGFGQIGLTVNTSGTADLNGKTILFKEIGLSGNGTIINSSSNTANFNTWGGAGWTSTFGGSIKGLGTISCYLGNGGGAADTLNLTGSAAVADFNLRGCASGTNTVNVSGALDATFITVGRDIPGVLLNVNGGLLTSTTGIAQIRVGFGSGGGTLTVGNGGTIITPSIGSYSSGSNARTNVFNIDSGGSVYTSRIFVDASGTTTLAGSSFTVNLNGGTIYTNANGNIFDNGGGYPMTVQIGSAGAFINTNGFNSTAAHEIVDAPSAAGGLTKLGLGTLTLAGTNTYHGTTTVANGTLALAASGSISGDPLVLGVSASTSGTFDVTSKSSYLLPDISGNGTFNIGAGKTITAAGNVSPGFGDAGKLNVTGNFTLDVTAATALEIGGQSAGMFDVLNVSGTFTYGGTLNVTSLGAYDLTQVATYHLITAGTYSNSADFFSVVVNGVTLTNSGGVWTGGVVGTNYTFTESTGILAVAVPEPGTWAMLVGGFGMLLGLQRAGRRFRP